MLAQRLSSGMKVTRVGAQPSFRATDENPLRKAYSYHSNRWWTGGAFRGLPPGKARDSFSGPRCQPADRQRVAESLGFTPPLHAGAVRRAPRFAVSGPGQHISHEAGSG